MREEYKTVQSDAAAEFIERKSRFIATVRPVTEEKQALDLIAECRSKYYDATHNVYAYIIGENNICRYSDDGEPSGTAGVPVLEVIKKEGLVDVCVVVTRYFGGILLGAGGLIRAYGQSAKEGLHAAGIITRTLCDVVKVKSDYNLFGKIQYETMNKGYFIKDTVFDAIVTMEVCIKTSETDNYIKLITELTNALAVCEVVGQQYLDL